MHRGRTAVLTGDRGHPAVELEFGFEPGLIDLVKELPGRRWDAERRRWVVSDFGRDPLAALEDLGFPGLTDINGIEVGHVDPRPIARPCPEDPNTWEVYPRWGGYAKRLAGLISPSDVRDEERGCWLISPERLRGQDWIELTRPLDQAPASPEPPALPTLPYDLTLEGLRGVPSSALSCVHRQMADRLDSVGLGTVHALLHHVPRRYLDLSEPHSVADAGDDAEPVAILCTVSKVAPAFKRGGIVRVTVIDDDGKRVSCRWFNAPYIARRVHAGQRVVVFGKLERSARSVGMSNPLIEPVDADAAGHIIGFYRASAKNDVSTWMIRRAAAEAANRLGDLADPVPRALTAARGLPGRAQAYRQVHDPDSTTDAALARDRLAYDELLRMQAVLAMRKAAAASSLGIAHDVRHILARRHLEALPYPLTGAQRRVIREVTDDMADPRPMSRLLHGEVGSGKTEVATLAMLEAVDAGHQAAMAAPTEILASQHFDGIAAHLAGLSLDDGTPLRVELLTNKVTGKRRKDVLAGLADGSVHLVIGTHALFADAVAFADLSLVVLDEQHRFGLEQRQALTRKRDDGRTPDLLQMTATPIPRTALMTTFADLDTSTLDEMPPGRAETTTEWVIAADPSDARSPAWRAVRDQVGQGRQVFVVTPLISESATREAAACHDTAEALSAGALAGLRIATVTGKDSPADRSATMARFAAGDVDVLVATTVIEVGVNVPNATVMVVLGADGFGLAQLHQLRGRVGRGSHAGQCWLVADPRTPAGEERMRAMVETSDGFVLSEVDLRLRGAGHVTSTVQSGTGADLLVANVLEDADLLAWAKEDAFALVAADPKLDAHPSLRAEIDAFLPAEAKAWLAAA